MHPSIRHLHHACRITLFTRANCSLCENAKRTLSEVWDVRPFQYTEIDVMKPEAMQWKGLYEFDAPVIHISKSEAGEEDPAHSARAAKLMHRFNAEDVKAKMDMLWRGAEGKRKDGGCESNF
ncbi:glutaredoxin domain containing protein [Diplocarpon rosae]|nr:glutaredoxin domain containing protein [Diplocarpon rosae]